jgi:hypothetical protein
MTRQRSLILTILLAAAHLGVKAQGCSDAGVCTAGPIGEVPAVNDSTAAQARHFARLTFSYAGGEQGTIIAQVTPEVSLGITERLAFQFKVPYVAVSGNLGSTGGIGGIGDPVVTGSYAFVKQDQRRLECLLGLKWKAGDAGLETDGRPLPMPYQTSLGTADLLLGINYRIKRLSMALAYQHVLAQRNRNGFLHAAWGGSADSAAALGYFESAGLERANDAVLRAQYAVPIGRLLLQPGLLAIIHLAEDSRLTAGDPQQRIAIAGSSGTTLNLTVDARFRLDTHLALEGAFGTPLLVREVRPDGLTRSAVLNLGLRYVF